jgi:Zn-finger nucleic acid-binding protein
MSRAFRCEQCGAGLEGDVDGAVTCGYCGMVHAPRPREVQVPVPVQVVQNVVHVSGGAMGHVVPTCPHCRLALVSVTAEGVTLAGCGRCGGIWLDNASAGALVASPQRVFLDLADRSTRNTERNTYRRSTSPTCPTCGAVLTERKHSGLTLDICEAHGTWFDPSELGILVRKLLAIDPFTAPLGSAGRPDTIPCASCQTALARERANVTGKGMLCDGCWRGIQSAELARAEAAHQSTVGTAALALGGIALIAMASAATSRRS